MKKVTAILISLIMIVSICACGAKSTGTGSGQDTDSSQGKTTAAEAAGSESEAPEDTSTAEKDAPEEGGEAANQSKQGMTSTETETSEEDQMQEDMEELSAIGDVETENGILTVTITVPADLVGETTQESLDESKGTLYRSAVLNEDGSVTYKMTKAQHRAMLENLAGAVDETSQELIDDDENYAISAVTHNDDLTEFNVTLDGTEIGLGDYFTVYSFYMYGLIYGKFSGKTPEHMIVNFYDSDGNLIEAVDSADLEDAESSGETEDTEEYVNTGENTY